MNGYSWHVYAGTHVSDSDCTLCLYRSTRYFRPWIEIYGHVVYGAYQSTIIVKLIWRCSLRSNIFGERKNYSRRAAHARRRRTVVILINVVRDDGERVHTLVDQWRTLPRRVEHLDGSLDDACLVSFLFDFEFSSEKKNNNINNLFQQLSKLFSSPCVVSFLFLSFLKNT